MTGSAAPLVLLSRSALEQNARRVLADGGAVDLRHDAFGHGLDEVAPIVADAGATDILVDAQQDVDRLAGRGIRARLDGTADIDAHVLFGVPDAAESAALPVMSLEGRVLSTKPLLSGEAVSYGYTHRAQQDTRVALVTGGYAQGILRALGNRASVQIGGGIHPIVGRIAMDVCVVDLEGTDAAAGTPVLYFGGTGAMRDALAHWAEVTGLTALEMAVVIGRHGERSWIA
ncbi:alanine racemase [Microbacterium sp. W4I4]|uniref:alanine racemase C-terminal domain-containing protein n=1 Tax=Microbacterium sp. W4I4 TaxID=3042295 RepID=UPI00278AD1CD|nr:alanine racemase C-terminal domain-containing protein [Microbacterium sp. W4I4]MDQ0612744.1 alanine racemase [Microbacterium sp. W4I4]